MWNFAWIPGVTPVVLLASMRAMICDAKECALDDEHSKSGGSPA
jgi:predicted outer membrane lipoprotein